MTRIGRYRTEELKIFFFFFFFFFFLFFFGTRVSVASFASRQNFEADNIRGYEALFNLTVRLIRANL